jgi:ATP-binding cassette, subfamily B (MDR/TAP), member 1
MAQNIAYGTRRCTTHVHDFTRLPHGSETRLCENAAVSGGQAQQLQLTQPARILVLDKCTSALDPANEAAALGSVCAAKVGRTAVAVMYKLQAMRM